MTVRKLRVKMTIGVSNGDSHEVIMFPDKAEEYAKMVDRRWSWSRFISWNTDSKALVLRRREIVSMVVTAYPSLVIK